MSFLASFGFVEFQEKSGQKVCILKLYVLGLSGTPKE
jgi:hypothetical protein